MHTDVPAQPGSSSAESQLSWTAVPSTEPAIASFRRAGARRTYPFAPGTSRAVHSIRQRTESVSSASLLA